LAGFETAFNYETIQVAIVTAVDGVNYRGDMLQQVWNELDYRLDVVRVTKGAHIEHLLAQSIKL